MTNIYTLRPGIACLLHGCFIRIAIDWDSQQDLVHARETLAKTLGAEFLYGEDQP